MDSKKEDIEKINKLIQETKNINSIDHYQKGEYCDAQDETKQWCVGEIIERTDDKIKVHFEGWSNKFDEVWSFKNRKVEHFRRYSRGYTGQKVTAYRSLTFIQEDLTALRNNIKEIILSNFSCLQTPMQITQMIRGRIFTLIDIFMTNPYNSTSHSVVVPEIVDMLYDYLDMAILYLKYFQEHLYLTEYLEKYSDLYLYDNTFALMACLYEVMLTLRRIFGKDERVNAFYKVNLLYIRVFQTLLRKLNQRLLVRSVRLSRISLIILSRSQFIH
jgi:hypothetical protein